MIYTLKKDEAYSKKGNIIVQHTCWYWRPLSLVVLCVKFK